MMAINRQAFLDLADYIEAADRFDLNHYIAFTETSRIRYIEDGRNADILWSNCGTTGCVAGWANAMTNHSHLEDTYHAREVLGITLDQGQNLFFAMEGSIWERLHAEYHWQCSRDTGLSDWSQITAKQAADVLRRIARGEVIL